MVAAVAALGLFGNLAMGRNGSTYLHAYADSARAQLAMLELARGTVDRGFIPAYETPGVTQIQMLIGAGGYLDGVDRYGSPAFSIPELLAQDPEVRTGADTVLVAADKLALEPAGVDARNRYMRDDRGRSAERSGAARGRRRHRCCARGQGHAARDSARRRSPSAR